jgi:hypothetical protein
MILAIILVLTAALALVFILGLSVSRTIQVSGADRQPIQPIDIEAFRNLVDPGETEYLRHRLPAADFRSVQRERLRATAAYIQVAGRNAAILALLGQAALAHRDAQTAEAARQLVDRAMLLRRNATLALMRIYLASFWPTADPAAIGLVRGYEQLNGCAMLLGRLQNPAAPIRIAAMPS